MKVLVSDFDKTLYTSNYKENVEAINNFINRGNIFIIATGRSLNALKKDLDDNLKYSYIICNDGGVIYDKNLKVIYRKNIPTRYLIPIYYDIKKCPYIGNALFTTLIKNYDEPVINTNVIIARIIDREKTKIYLEELKNKYAVSAYMSDRWINIDNIIASKGNALKIICKKINYNYQEAYAIGDNLNDISMCQICHGVALNHATTELKDVCPSTAKTVKELADSL